MSIASRPSERRQRAAAVLATLGLFGALLFATARLWQFGVASPFTDPIDFRAFYCAGAALAEHRDPYRLEPVRSCQRAVLASAGLRLNEHFVLPAPLPPYALSGFAALSRLPYRFAAEAWMSANVLALFASIALLASLSHARLAYATGALFLSAGIVCLSLGQVVPLVLAGALFAALGARRANGTQAVTGAAIAAVEPHLALPLWLGLAFFVPQARKPLAFAAAAFVTLTLLMGPALTSEYVHSVIPQHAAAELPSFETQYGLSSLLAALGVSSRFALQAGSASYVTMLLAGLALGRALAREFRDGAFVIATPLAAAVVGGPFLHIQQTVVAVPLGFMLAARLPRSSPAFGAVVAAIVLLAIPWPLADMAAPARPAPAVPAAPAATARPAPGMANESIEIPYAAFLARFDRRPGMHSFGELFARKLPTWSALLALLLIAAVVARSRRMVRPGDALLRSGAG